MKITTLMQQASPIIPNKASPPVINMHSIPTTGFKPLYPTFFLRGVGCFALV